MTMAEDPTRAGIAMSVRWMVPVVARAKRPPARLATARVRLNAITAHEPSAVGGELAGRQVRKRGFLQVGMEGRTPTHEPLRSQCVTSTGPDAAVLAVASSMFSPRV